MVKNITNITNIAFSLFLIFQLTGCTRTAIAPPPVSKWKKIKAIPDDSRPECKIVSGTTDIVLGSIWSVILFPIGLSWGIPQIIHGSRNNQKSRLCEQYNNNVLMS